MKKYVSSKYHFDNLLNEQDQLLGDIRLFQIGDLYCQSDSRIEEHSQYCYEISYVVSGKGVFIINGEKIDLCAGDICWCYPSDRHIVIANPQEPFRYFFLGFELVSPNPMINALNVLTKEYGSPSGRRTQDKFNINELFLKSFSEIPFKENSAFVLEHLINLIICFAVRNYSFVAPAEIQIPSDKAALFYSILNYIEENCLRIKKLTDLERVFGYSYSYISHIFSEFYDISAKEYLMNLKFQKAYDLLKLKRINPTQAAELLGYVSLHPFSRIFKQRFNISPNNVYKN